jgi:hypothetical protein
VHLVWSKYNFVVSDSTILDEENLMLYSSVKPPLFIAVSNQIISPILFLTFSMFFIAPKYFFQWRRLYLNFLDH